MLKNTYTYLLVGLLDILVINLNRVLELILQLKIILPKLNVIKSDLK